MNVIFVHPFPCASQDIQHELELLRREEIVFQGLADRGESVSAFGFFYGSVTESPILVQSGGNYWTFIPYGRDYFDAYASLIQANTFNNQDLLIMKGIGNPLASLVWKSFLKRVLIVGGKYKSGELLKANLVLCENAGQFRFLRRILPPTRVAILPKYVRPEFFDERLSTTEFDVAVVSNFFPWKNHRCLARLAEYPISIAFLGDGPTRSEVENLFASANAQATFYGRTDSSVVAKVLLSSKILVHPSLSEGSPRAVVEALCSGCPVIAVRNVVADPVTHGVNGLLVKENELVESTWQLLLNETKLLDYSLAARRVAESIFNEDVANSVVQKIRESTTSKTTCSENIRIKIGSGLINLTGLVDRLLGRLRKLFAAHGT